MTVAVDGVPRKTFTGVEKLFEISKNQPVAMMIYSNAEIMGLPWKTVITAYKQQARNPVFKSVEEYAQFQTLNDRYHEKFGFPFVMAVRASTRAEILQAFSARLENDAATEFETALEEIHKIAKLRLQAMEAGE